MLNIIWEPLDCHCGNYTAIMGKKRSKLLGKWERLNCEKFRNLI